MSDGKFNGLRFAHKEIGPNSGEVRHLMVWGHGWGQNGSSFVPLASTVLADVRHILLDFPGFGATPPPPQTWGTAEYADATAVEIKRLFGGKSVIWVGHSFGGRVGIQLAARHPELISGLVLIGSAGLPRKRSAKERLWLWLRVRLFKTLKFLSPLIGVSVDQLRARFGSADYRSAGSMREVFLSVIREDLSEEASQVSCPVLLIYGSDDKETPPEIGERFAGLIPRAQLKVLPGLDHYTVLGNGRHLVATRIMTFMEQL